MFSLLFRSYREVSEDMTHHGFQLDHCISLSYKFKTALDPPFKRISYHNVKKGTPRQFRGPNEKGR
jgi:hypothetical protein